jgi:stage III sporulation protein AA
MVRNQKDELYHIFPTRMRSTLEQIPWYQEHLEEIRLRVGQPPAFCYGGETKYFPAFETMRLTYRDMQEMFEYLCEYSKYAYSEQLQQGFLALPGGIRVGVAGQAGATYPMFFNIRCPKERKGCAKDVLPYLFLPKDEIGVGAGIFHTLVLSPPGAGKTTLLRDMIRLLSASGVGNISVVDERFELAACHQGVPRNDLGGHTDVYAGYSKPTSCMQAIRTMAPQILAVDEIGGKEDAEILSYAMHCGVKILATMHANSIEEYQWKRQQDKTFATLHFERLIRIRRHPGGARSYQVYDKEGQVLCVVS